MLERYLCVYTVLFGLTAGSPPSPPRSVHVTTVGTNLLVKWTAPAQTYGEILHYIVAYSILPSRDTIDIVVDSVLYALIGVSHHPGRLYRVTVKAENADGLSEASSPRFTRTDCGSQWFVPFGSNITLESPSYPQDLYPGTLCKWTLTTNNSYAFEVNVSDLEISDVIQGHCSRSYLHVQSVPKTDTKLCSNRRTFIRTRGKKMEIVFLLNGARGKFSLSVTTVVPIPGPPTNVVMRSSSDVINVSWHPPAHYNLQHVSAYVIRFSVLPYSKTTAVTVSGRFRTFPVRSRGHEGQLYRVSVSALHVNQEGDMAGPFYVRAACGGSIILNPSERRTITSPEYPSSYRPGVVCKWSVVTLTRLPVYFRIVKMDIEESLFCNSDYITLSAWSRDRRQCGVIDVPEKYKKFDVGVNITFVSDQHQQGHGFKIEIADIPVTSISPFYSTSTTSTTAEHQKTTTDNPVLSIPINHNSTDSSVTVKPDHASDVGRDTMNDTTTVETVNSLSSSTVNINSTDLGTIYSSSVVYPTVLLTSGSSVHTTHGSTTRVFSNTPHTSSVISDPQISSSETVSRSSATASPVSHNQLNFNSKGSTTRAFDAKPTESTQHTSQHIHATPVEGVNTSGSDVVSTNFLSSCEVVSAPSTDDSDSSIPVQYFEPNVSDTATQVVKINLVLHRQGALNKTLSSKEEMKLKQRLTRQFQDVFNTTTLFEDATVNIIRLTDVTSLRVILLVYYKLKQVLYAMQRNTSFTLLSYVNMTSLASLASRTNNLMDGWDIDQPQLLALRSSPIFANQELRNPCLYPDDVMCGANYTCVRYNASSLGLLCCRTGVQQHKCPLMSMLKPHCKTPSHAPEQRNFMAAPVVAGVVGVVFVVVVTILALLRRAKKRQKVQIQKQHGNTRLNLQIHDIMLQTKSIGDDFVNFTSLAFNKKNRKVRPRTGSLPSDTTLRRNQKEKDLDVKVQKLGAFIEDKETLKQRLKMKQRIRHGHSM